MHKKSYPKGIFCVMVYLIMVSSAAAQVIFSGEPSDTLKSYQKVDKIDLGYYTVDSRNITSSIAVLKPDNYSIFTTDVNRQLQGKASGITVIADGDPSSLASVMIRGGFTPYYVVDGIPVHNISGINYSDIESITVIKDGAAAIFGMKAMNGVIIINTKKGNDGLHVSYNMSMGMQTPGKGNRDKLLSTKEHAELQWLVYKNDKMDGTVEGDYVIHPIYGSSTNPEPLFPSWAANTDWYDAVTRKAAMMQHNLSISGANKNGKIYVGFGYLKQNGIVIHNYAQRYNVRMNAELNLFKGHLKIGENFGYNRHSDLRLSTRYRPYPLFSEILRMQPIVPVYVKEEIVGMSHTFMPGEYGGSDISWTLGNGSNVVAQQIRNKEDEYDYHYYTGNVYVEINILDGLSLKSSYGLNAYKGNILDFDFRSYENSWSLGSISRAFEDDTKSKIATWSNTVNFDKSFGNHSLQALLGYEESEVTPEEYVNAEYRGEFDNKEEYQQNELIRTFYADFKSSAFPQKSFFGSLNYGLLHRYYIGVSARQDKGISAAWQNTMLLLYGSKKEWYPAIMAAWHLSNEPFMKSISWIGECKVRGSYGKTGDVKNNFQYSVITDIGFDAVLFKNKVGITMDWFSNQAKNIFMPSNIVFPEGVNDFNSGEYKISGTDLNIRYQNRWNDLRLSAGIAFSKYKSRIEKVNDYSDYYWAFPALMGSPVVKNQVGHSLSAFNVYKVEGLFQSEQEASLAPSQYGRIPGGLRYANVVDDESIDYSDKLFLGDPNPDFTVGINVNLAWKNIDASAFLYASAGNDVFNFTRYFTDFWWIEMGQKNRKLLHDSWTESNRDASFPVASQQNTPDVSDYFIEDGSYLRMKSLQIGYTFSPEVLRNVKLSGFRVYLQSVNLFTITNYSGLDPETGGPRDAFGIDTGNYPNTRQFIFGLQVEI